MPLTMARPWKHHDSGVYWFRKDVPAHLRTFVGKRKEKVSLQAKDPAEARVRHGNVAAEVAARWASLEAAGQGLTAQPDVIIRSAFSEREAHEVALVIYDRYLETYSDNPREGFRKPEIGRTLWHEVDDKPLWESLELLSDHKQREAEVWCADESRGIAAYRGLQLEEAGLAVLTRAIGAAVQSASLKLPRLLQGECDVALPSPATSEMSITSVKVVGNCWVFTVAP